VLALLIDLGRLFVEHLLDGLVGALVLAGIDYGRRRRSARRARRTVIYGPDGRPLRTVEVRGQGERDEDR
jgi:hypothetical protein